MEENKCRICGCTEEDCSQCIDATGEPCTWVPELANDDGPLCSSCVRVIFGKEKVIQILGGAAPKYLGPVDSSQLYTEAIRINVLTPAPRLVRLFKGPRDGELRTEKGPMVKSLANVEPLGVYKWDGKKYDGDGRELWYWKAHG